MTKVLLSAGIAVFTPDTQYCGERSYSNGFESPMVMVFEKRWLRRNRDMVVQSVVDCRRAIDYLEPRGEIDKSRIGVTGYSLGGIEAFALTALDTRVKVAVACVTPLSYLDHNMGGDPVLAPRNFVRAIQDRPFLMQMGRNDPSYTVEQAQRLYDLIPGSKKELVFYDSDHRLPVDYVPKAAAWLHEHLK